LEADHDNVTVPGAERAAGVAVNEVITGASGFRGGEPVVADDAPSVLPEQAARPTTAANHQRVRGFMLAIAPALRVGALNDTSQRLTP
jgi:hypothetical protein